MCYPFCGKHGRHRAGNRREFISLLGGAAVAWPLAAPAQHGDRVRRVALFMSMAENDVESKARIAAFVQRMQQLGWTDGRNVGIETRWPAGDTERIRRYAAELAALAPDVIVATGATVGALLQAIRDVPVVFTVIADPVGAGFVNSLARPGDNATGFTMFEYSLSGKWLELLKQIAPRVRRAAVIRDASIPSGIGQFSAIQALAPSLGSIAPPSTALRDASAGWRHRRMTDHTPISQVSRLEVISTGARRRWTLAEKQRIVAESYSAPRVVSATARRNGLSASQLFTWRRLARAGRLIEAEEAATFAPAIISREASSTSSPSFPERVEGTENLPHAPCPVGVAGRIEIVLACGRRVVVDNGVDSAALARVLAVLERA